MKRLHIIIILFIFTVPLLPYAAAGEKAAKEAASSAERGKYLAERGLIVRPEEVYIDSYVAHINYHYPRPEAEFGITLYSGHRQVSSRGQEEVIQIGIQGRELSFDELPPLNLAFVIDKSGSMAGQDKMVWVKEAFYIFIEKVRDKDFVSLVFFDSTAETVFSSTNMDSRYKRERFKDEVARVRPGSGTNLFDGLELGYKEVLSNYRQEYVNRVLILTDGLPNQGRPIDEILEMAEIYKNMGVNVSTIGVGVDFDLQFIRELSDKGGGSSRFISGREEMEKIFGSELDRMVVPIANDLEMKLEFLPNVEILGTWGYNYRIEGDTIYYYLSTLHHRDYETILVQVRIPSQALRGEQDLARFSITYRDAEDNTCYAGPYYLRVSFVEQEHPVTGFSDGMVLRSGTMLHFAQALKRIGELYYSRQAQRALDLTVTTKKELVNAKLRLDEVGFDDEIEILNNYIRILSGELAMSDKETTKIVVEEEIAPPVRERSLQEHLENLFREITLDLGSRIKGAIAISGFSTEEGKTSGLVTLLNEIALIEVAKQKIFRWWSGKNWI